MSVCVCVVWGRHATRVCQLRHDQMEQGATEPHTARSMFLLSSGGAGGGYYRVAFDTQRIASKNQFPWQTLVACLVGGGSTAVWVSTGQIGGEGPGSSLPHSDQKLPRNGLATHFDGK